MRSTSELYCSVVANYRYPPRWELDNPESKITVLFPHAVEIAGTSRDCECSFIIHRMTSVSVATPERLLYRLHSGLSGYGFLPTFL